MTSRQRAARRTLPGRCRDHRSGPQRGTQAARPGLPPLCAKAGELPLRTGGPGRGQRQHRPDRRRGAGLAARPGAGPAARLRPAGQGPRGADRAARHPGPVRRLLRRGHGDRPVRPGRHARPAAPRASHGDRDPGRWTARSSRSGTARSGGSAPPRSARSPAGWCPAPPTPSADSSSSPGRWPGRPRGRLRTAGLRLRHRADRDLPAARGPADRDPGGLAGRAGLDVLGLPALGGDPARRGRYLAAVPGPAGPPARCWTRPRRPPPPR